MSSSHRLRIVWALDVSEGMKGGGVISAQRFVEALRRRHDITLLTTGAPGPGRVTLPAFQPPPIGRVMREMGFTFARPHGPTIEATLREADIVHVWFPFWLGVRTASIARRLGKPVVAAFHVQPENMFHNVGLRLDALNEWTYRLFLRTLYDTADAVICPSPFARDALLRRGLRAPVEVVSNGVTIPPLRPAPLERFERHRGRILLLAVGRLAREKRLDVVIEGVRRSRHAANVQLVITGRGPEERRVRQLAATLPRPAEVLFVSDADLDRLLATADLLLHASEVELEGMAVLEALARGTPALVADAPQSAARDLALGPELLFRAGDPDDLARTMDRLLDAPERLQDARREALALARRFDFDASVSALDALYSKLAPRAGPVHVEDRGAADSPMSAHPE